ncbi:class I SAM-dependent methyltransferase [Hyphomonas pacifica]|nr:class I SAM-dependent methyltransferase [Hyphomonas pacifica]
MTNTQQKMQSEYWNTSGAERWQRNAHHLEQALFPFSAEIIGHIAPAPTDNILDIGCGTGDLSTDLACLTPDGQVVGLDISAPLLETARNRNADAPLPNLSFILGDASSWQPSAYVDAVVSRFGVMFFEHPEAAFENIRNMLKPGGRMAFAAWASMEENEWVSAPLSAVQAYLNEARPGPLPVPAPNMPGPFGLSDRNRIEHILAASGWSDILISPWLGHLEFQDMQSLEGIVDFMTSMGGVARMIGSGLIEADEARAAVTEFLTPIWEDGTATIWRAKAWIVSAKNPEPE